MRIMLPDDMKSVLAAVSGGADSVAMLALLKEASERQSVRLTAAHFEHGIRAEAALADAAFVRALCAEWGVPLIEGSADVPALSHEWRMGLEEAAREARYAFLRQAKAKAEADCIALAHHRDDQAETVMMHLFRGAGLHGLAGMREREGDLYRPLLGVPKQTLVEYLGNAGIPWREDATNAIADNPRNGLRLDVIPNIERFYPGAGRAICRFAQIAQDEDDYMESETDRILTECAIQLPGCWLIRPNRGSLPPRALLMRAVHRITGQGGDSVTAACRLSEVVCGTVEMTGGWRAYRGRRGLYLERGAATAITPRQLPQQGEIELEGSGLLRISEGTGSPVRNKPFCQEMDAAALEGAQIRTRRPGDTIHPLGAPGRQKLKEYLINRHVDQPLKDRLPLIARGSEVLWVMGEGISEQAKLRAGSAAKRLELTNGPLISVYGGTKDDGEGSGTGTDY